MRVGIGSEASSAGINIDDLVDDRFASIVLRNEKRVLALLSVKQRSHVWQNIVLEPDKNLFPAQAVPVIFERIFVVLTPPFDLSLLLS